MAERENSRQEKAFGVYMIEALKSIPVNLQKEV
jgi:hypothetical protein